MNKQEKFNLLMNEIYSDKTMFMLYFSSLISSDNISSADECREKLNQLDMIEVFLKEKSDEEYLNRIRSGIHLKQIMGHDLQSIQDGKDNMELIKRYMRGHNVFDIFYGRYKNSETELLTKYVELAPREDFADILNSIDRFIIFESRKK